MKPWSKIKKKDLASKRTEKETKIKENPLRTEKQSNRLGARDTNQEKCSNYEEKSKNRFKTTGQKTKKQANKQTNKKKTKTKNKTTQ